MILPPKSARNDPAATALSLCEACAMEVPTIVVPEVTEESIEERALNEIFSPTEMPAAEKARRAAMMRKKGRLAKMRKDQRSVRNSTSSVYADSTIVRPNLSSLIRRYCPRGRVERAHVCVCAFFALVRAFKCCKSDPTQYCQEPACMHAKGREH